MLISSEEPLVHVLSNAEPLALNRVSLSRLPCLNAKYISGITAPTAWLIAVAAAAPINPHPSTPTNSTSSTILVTPAATVTASPRLGRSAVMKKL